MYLKCLSFFWHTLYVVLNLAISPKHIQQTKGYFGLNRLRNIVYIKKTGNTLLNLFKKVCASTNKK